MCATSDVPEVSFHFAVFSLILDGDSAFSASSIYFGMGCFIVHPGVF